MGITASRLKAMGLIDQIIDEPLGGAHRDYSSTMELVRNSLQGSLEQLQSIASTELLEKRSRRLMEYGKFKGSPTK